MMNYSMFPAGNTFNSAGNWFGLNQQQSGLTGRVTGRETPQQLAFLGQQDKAINVARVKENTKYLYYQAWGEALQKREKQDQERRRRALDSGVIFG
jgi:hypothetical protein